MSLVVETYPVSGLQYRYKEPKIEKAIDLPRLEAIYEREGMRRMVSGILMVLENQQPGVILLQSPNNICKLPGGRLQPGENEIEGLKRKLSSKLGATLPALQPNWQIGQCVGIWWWPNFEFLSYPYCPANITEPKVCMKLFIVHLPEIVYFEVPSNYELIAVPLVDLYNNFERFGPILSQIPQQLSRFQVNLMD